MERKRSGSYRRGIYTYDSGNFQVYPVSNLLINSGTASLRRPNKLLARIWDLPDRAVVPNAVFALCLSDS